jgi:hypothetical protein
LDISNPPALFQSFVSTNILKHTFYSYLISGFLKFKFEICAVSLEHSKYIIHLLIPSLIVLSLMYFAHKPTKLFDEYNFVVVKAENFWLLLIYHYKIPSFNICWKFGNKAHPVDAKQPDSELTGETINVLNLTEWLRVAETGLMLSADSDCIGQRAVAPGQRIL